jgi:hypothetical protein
VSSLRQHAEKFQTPSLFAALGVGEGQVIQRDCFGLEQRLGFAGDRGSPIDERAEHVEKQGFDRERRIKLLTYADSIDLSSPSGSDQR